MFEKVIKDCSRFIPKSDKFVDCCIHDKYYSLFDDTKQLELIYKFLNDVCEIKSLSDFFEFECAKAQISGLKKLLAEKAPPEDQERYLKTLKETIMVFVRDNILNLDEKERDEVSERSEIEFWFQKIGKLNQQSLDEIFDTERRRKNAFLKQFKGSKWNEKLVDSDPELLSYKVNQIAIKIDSKPNTLKSEWLKDKKSSKFTEYESYVTSMPDSPSKREHLFEIAQIYATKKPCLKLFLNKAIDLVDKSIAIEEFMGRASGANSDSEASLRDKYELKGRIHLELARKYPFASFEKYTNLKKSKNSFVKSNSFQSDSPKRIIDDNDFVALFVQAFENPNKTNLYEQALKLNPYFFEAEYQMIMRFFELNECVDVFHFNEKYSRLLHTSQPILKLFDLLLASKRPKQLEFYVDKIFKVRVKNNKQLPLYLKLIKTEYSYRIAYNDEGQLVNLLKYGKLSVIEV